jgi:hypothetical protein
MCGIDGPGDGLQHHDSRLFELGRSTPPGPALASGPGLPVSAFDARVAARPVFRCAGRDPSIVLKRDLGASASNEA